MGHKNQISQQQTDAEEAAEQRRRAPARPGRAAAIQGGGRDHRDPGGAFAVPQVSAHAGGVGHGMGHVVLLVDALKEVGHGSTGQHGHVLAAVGGGVSGSSRQLDVIFVFWGGGNEAFLFANAEKTTDVISVFIFFLGSWIKHLK